MHKINHHENNNKDLVTYLSHGEFSDPDETRSGRDFISEGVTDLGSSKWQFALEKGFQYEKYHQKISI